MNVIKRLRPLLFFLLGLLGVCAVILVFAPTQFVIQLTPAKSTQSINISQSNRANTQIGRQDVLLHVSSRIQGEVSVQQFVHYYFQEETAVSNFNQNLEGNPEWFPDGAEAYRITLPQREFSEQLLCHEQESERLVCEYRAQFGRWTVHTDYVSRNTAVYDQALFVEMIGQE